MNVAVSCNGKSGDVCPASKTLKIYCDSIIIHDPTITPLLFPEPPIMNAAHTKNVVVAGVINVGWKPFNCQAQNAPASAAIAAPNARLDAL